MRGDTAIEAVPKNEMSDFRMLTLDIVVEAGCEVGILQRMHPAFSYTPRAVNASCAA